MKLLHRPDGRVSSSSYSSDDPVDRACDKLSVGLARAEQAPAVPAAAEHVLAYR